MATIDVLMPVRNGIRFLGESIESITGQTYADWRLLILDHGSSDGSAELANSYAERDPRIRVLSMPTAEHLGGLLNAGLEHCDCRYVMRHDADDIALPNRMELMNEFYAANKQYVVVGGEALMIDGNGRQIDRLQPPTDPEANQFSRIQENGRVLRAGLSRNPPRFGQHLGKPLRRGLHIVWADRVVRALREPRCPADKIPGS